MLSTVSVVLLFKSNCKYDIIHTTHAVSTLMYIGMFRVVLNVVLS